MPSCLVEMGLQKMEKAGSRLLIEENGDSVGEWEVHLLAHGSENRRNW